MTNIALGFACAIFATRLSSRAVYFIQTGGSALSNTYNHLILTDASGMDWSTMYANALAQMLSDKNISTVNSSSHGDIITLPQNRSNVATTTTQQASISSDVAEQSSDAQLLSQSNSSRQVRVQSTDLLASALRSHSPNHSLSVSTRAASTSPKPHTQDLHSRSSPISDKIGGTEDGKQRLSPYPTIASDQQLSPNMAALGMTNLSNQKSPSRQQVGSLDGKDEVPLTAATTALQAKEELSLTEDTKLFLRHLTQQQLPQQQQKSIPGSIVIPGASGSDQQEEITIHPGGSGELTCVYRIIDTFAN